MIYFMGEFSKKQRLRKIHKVMREFKNGKLDKSYGGKVTNRKQAIAIALSEASRFSLPVEKNDNAEFMSNPLKKAYGSKTWNLAQKLTKKPLFTKRNLAIGAGTLAATGATSYGINKWREKRKKWWEL